MKKIICVDDSIDQREAVKSTFSADEYEVIEAIDGESGLNTILSHLDADLLVIDFHMPKLNGLEVLERVNAHRQDQKKIPTVMFTTETSKERRKIGQELGVDVWFIKPMRSESFLQVAEALIAKAS